MGAPCCARCKLTMTLMHTHTQDKWHTIDALCVCVPGSRKHSLGRMGGARVDGSGVLAMQARPAIEICDSCEHKCKPGKAHTPRTHPEGLREIGHAQHIHCSCV